MIKYCTVLLSALMLTGCAMAQRAMLEQTAEKATAQQDVCDQQRTKKWQPVTKCYYETVLPIYRDAGYPNIDLIELGYAHYADIHSEADKKKKDEQWVISEKAKIKAEINSLIIQRVNAMEIADAPRRAALANAFQNSMQSIGQMYQTQPIQVPAYNTYNYQPPAPRPVHCTTTPPNTFYKDWQTTCR